MRSESGVALVTLVFLILVLGVVAAGLAGLASSTAFGALESGDSTQAAFAAEAGLVRSLREGTTAPAPVPFGGATFTVANVGGGSVTRFAIGTKGLASRRLTTEPAFAYVPFSRVADTNSDVEIRVENVTGQPRTLSSFQLTWGGATAYCEEIRLRVLSGTNYGPVWTSVAAAGNRLASGEIATFNTGGPAVLVPAGATARLLFLRFRAAKTGAAALVDMDAIAFRLRARTTVTTFGETTVRIGGW